MLGPVLSVLVLCDISSFAVISLRKRAGPEVIKLEFILKLKIKRNDWLLTTK